LVQGIGCEATTHCFRWLRRWWKSSERLILAVFRERKLFFLSGGCVEMVMWLHPFHVEVWKIIFLFKWVICRFHVNLPGCMICYSEINADSRKNTHVFFPKTSQQKLFVWLHILFVDLAIFMSPPQKTNYPKHLSTSGSSTPKTYLKHRTSGGMTGCLRLYTPFFWLVVSFLLFS